MWNADRVAGVAEDLLDVSRDVGEEVARICVPSVPYAIHDSTSIRVDEAPEELARVAIDDRDLPVDQTDRTLVFHPPPVLWKDAWPMLPIGGDGDASYARHDAYRPILDFTNTRDRCPSEVDEKRIPDVLEDPQAIRAWVTRDVAVAEVQTEQVGIRGLVERSVVASGALAGSLADTTPGCTVMPPFTDRGAIDPRDTRDLAVVPTPRLRAAGPR